MTNAVKNRLTACVWFSAFLLKALVRRVQRQFCVLSVRLLRSTYDVEIRSAFAWIRSRGAEEGPGPVLAARDVKLTA
jgi:hypothetical protein